MAWLQLLHIPDWWKDSNVFKLWNEVDVAKVYSNASLEQINAYHNIHASFSWEVFEIPVGRELEYWGIKKDKNKWYVSKVIVSILDLSESKISIHQWKVVVKTSFIEWVSALWFSWFLIYPVLERILEERLWINQLHPRNISSSDIKDEIIYWTVTDLACSIDDLLDVQK